MFIYIFGCINPQNIPKKKKKHSVDRATTSQGSERHFSANDHKKIVKIEKSKVKAQRK